MDRCLRCGAPILPYQHFCTRCGLALHTGAGTNRPVPAPVCAARIPRQPDSSSLPIPYFIWSLALFFCFNPLGAPLSILAAYYTTRARSDSRKNHDLCIARRLCILSSAITAGTLVVLISALFAQGVF